jgi:hypothetical protein
MMTISSFKCTARRILSCNIHDVHHDHERGRAILSSGNAHRDKKEYLLLIETEGTFIQVSNQTTAGGKRQAQIDNVLKDVLWWAIEPGVLIKASTTGKTLSTQ